MYIVSCKSLMWPTRTNSQWELIAYAPLIQDTSYTTLLATHSMWFHWPGAFPPLHPFNTRYHSRCYWAHVVNVGSTWRWEHYSKSGVPIGVPFKKGVRDPHSNFLACRWVRILFDYCHVEGFWICEARHHNNKSMSQKWAALWGGSVTALRNQTVFSPSE